jgi:hypothetical protein
MSEAKSFDWIVRHHFDEGNPMTEDEHQAALFRARLEGMKAGVELAEKLMRAQHAASARTRRPPEPRRQRYDWIDHVCGISLIDRMMGIK